MSRLSEWYIGKQEHTSLADETGYVRKRHILTTSERLKQENRKSIAKRRSRLEYLIEMNDYSIGTIKCFDTYISSIRYTPEQLEAINKALEEQNKIKYCHYGRSTSIIVRSKLQAFAIFGYTCRELFNKTFINNTKDGAYIEYVPVIIDGAMIEESPDEGRCGLMYLMRMVKRKHKKVENPIWQIIYINTGWLYTSELKLTNDQIAENIAEEIDMKGMVSYG